MFKFQSFFFDSFPLEKIIFYLFWKHPKKLDLRQIRVAPRFDFKNDGTISFFIGNFLSWV